MDDAANDPGGDQAPQVDAFVVALQGSGTDERGAGAVHLMIVHARVRFLAALSQRTRRETNPANRMWQHGKDRASRWLSGKSRNSSAFVQRFLGMLMETCAGMVKRSPAARRNGKRPAIPPN